MSLTYSDHPISPLPEGWIAVALSDDVAAGTAIPVVVGGREVAVWRSESGKIQVWSDRCPHRGMRLSFGFVRGESLSCLYHGWRFAADGHCESIPAHPDLVPPATICATDYPVTEHAGMVWMGVGQPGSTPAGEVDGWTGARSITIDRPLDEVSAALSPDANPDRLVALQPVLGNRTRVHVAVRYDKVLEACLWIEGVQRDLEKKR